MGYVLVVVVVDEVSRGFGFGEGLVDLLGQCRLEGTGSVSFWIFLQMRIE